MFVRHIMHIWADSSQNGIISTEIYLIFYFRSLRDKITRNSKRNSFGDLRLPQGQKQKIEIIKRKKCLP